MYSPGSAPGPPPGLAPGLAQRVVMLLWAAVQLSQPLWRRSLSPLCSVCPASDHCSLIFSLLLLVLLLLTLLLLLRLACISTTTALSWRGTFRPQREHLFRGV